MRRLAKNTDPKYFSSPSASTPILGTPHDFGTPSPSESGSFDFFKEEDSRPSRAFWKRKTSNRNLSTSPAGFVRRSVSAQLAVPAPSALPLSVPNGRPPTRLQQSQSNEGLDDDVHEHCMAILRDLDQVVADFSILLSEARQRRSAARPAALPRRGSTDSWSDDEWFDAQDGETVRSRLLTIHGSDEEAREVESEGEEYDSDF